MRTLPVTAAVSLIAHGAIVALVAAYEPKARAVRSAPPVAVEIVEVAPPAPEAAPPATEAVTEAATEAVIDVVIAADAPRPGARAPAASPTPPAPAISTGARGASEIAAGGERGAPAGAEPGAVPGAGGERSPWFDLRRGGRPGLDLRLPAGRDALDNVPRGTDAVRGVAPTGKLQESGGGTHRSDQGVFVARVAPDGSVDLKDRGNVQVRIALPSAKDLGDAISRWYDSDKGPHGAHGERTLADNVAGSIDPGDRSEAVVAPIIGGGFDLTDAFMRGKGADPYASKKLAFLDATRDERVQIGTVHRERQLAQTAQIVQRNLERLWRAVPDPRARREALFEMWDEAAEDGGASASASGSGGAGGDRAAAAGALARKLVIGFIRARLPAGSADAYGAAELAALNRRRQSRAPFAPYE